MLRHPVTVNNLIILKSIAILHVYQDGTKSKSRVDNMRRTSIVLLTMAVILFVPYLAIPNQILIDYNQVSSEFSLSDTREIVWEAVYRYPEHSRGMQLVQCGDGDFAIAGYTNNTAGNDFDGWLARTDSLGNILWEYTYGGAANDTISSLVECQNGDFLLAGTSGSLLTNTQGWIFRTDSHGIHLWNTTFGSNDYDDAFNSVVECKDGDIAVTGYTTTASGDRDLWILRTNSTGHLNWSEIVTDIYDQEGFCIIECSDRGLLVGGYYGEWGGAVDESLHAVLYRTNTDGSLNSSQTFGGVNPSAFHSVVECDDGHIVALGYTSVMEDLEQIYMQKTTSSLDHIWYKFWGDANQDFGVSLVSCQDNGFALLCNTNTTNGDAILIRTDSEGNQKWNSTYGSTEYDNVSSIVECTDGGYIALGYTGDTQSDIWLFRIQPVQLGSPVNQVVEYGTSFENEVEVQTVGSSLNHTILNDTTNFEFIQNENSVTLSNKTILQLGTYRLNLWLNDTLGEFLSVSFTITVEEASVTTTTTSLTTTSTSPNGTAPRLFGLDMQTLILIAAGVCLLIVCLMVRRRS